jgi:hypothetical protein
MKQPPGFPVDVCRIIGQAGGPISVGSPAQARRTTEERHHGLRQPLMLFHE